MTDRVASKRRHSPSPESGLRNLYNFRTLSLYNSLKKCISLPENEFSSSIGLSTVFNELQWQMMRYFSFPVL